jgi:hypothetical protein
VRSGVAIASQLQAIGTAFVDLQQARHDADYDTATPMRHPEADSKVTMAENAFRDWRACQADPSSGVFLTDLFLRSVLKSDTSHRAPPRNLVEISEKCREHAPDVPQTAHDLRVDYGTEFLHHCFRLTESGTIISTAHTYAGATHELTGPEETL